MTVKMNINTLIKEKGFSMLITDEEKNPKTRRYCHHCHKKKYIQGMVKVYYPLIKECYWFCAECFDNRDSNYLISEGIIPKIKEI